MGTIRIAQLVVDPPIVRKLRDKHGVSVQEVKEALCWPADCEAVWEDDVTHGPRVIAHGYTRESVHLIAALMPANVWDPDCDTWVVKTARRV